MRLNAELAGHIELSFLAPDATQADIEQLCQQAQEFSLAAVVVSPARVILASMLLEASSISVATVVSSPFGLADSDTKRFEAEAAVDNGADAISVCVHPGQVRDGESQDPALVRELRDVVHAVDERPVTAVLDPRWLSDKEMIRVCRLVEEAGVQRVQLPSDFCDEEPQPDQVKIWRKMLGSGLELTAVAIDANAGPPLQDLLDAGAQRLGLRFSRLDSIST